MNTCPKCNTNLDGDLIYESFLDVCGGDEAKALELAEMYGATKTEGRWDKKISIYDLEKDRTVAYRCPECNHQWEKNDADSD